MSLEKSQKPPEGEPTVLEARLTRAQAIAKVGSWEIDLVTRRVWASIEAFRIYGIVVTPHQELPLPEVQAMVLPQYRPLLDKALADLIAGTGPYDVEFEIHRPIDGVTLHIHSLAMLVRNADGKPIAVSGSLHDNTDIVARDRAMLQALRASEEKARMAFEQAADAIFLGDSLGHFIAVNEHACKLTGYSREELLGRNMGMLFSAAVREWSPLRYDLIHQGAFVSNERVLTRKNGQELPIEMHAKKLSDGSLQCIMRDLSERRRLEKQLQLRQRMDSIGTLASGIAHDFNNILAGIIGYASLLTEPPSVLDADQSRYVEDILLAAQRAADLVRNLRSLSHPDAIQQDSFDLDSVASEVVQVLQATTDRLITKSTNVQAGQFAIRGNSSNLYHALLNLAVNAVQAIEDKGATADDRVSIDAEVCQLQQNERPGILAGRYVRVTVSDTGNGMTEEVRQRAFEPLFTTKNKGERKGQGLGLAMVYNIIVHQHGGAVDVETREGQGSKFNLYLPSGESTAPVAAVSSVRVVTGSERILVVEDEEQLSRLAEKVLRRFGYDVLLAMDGRIAVDLFQKEHTNLQLVILDRSLPGLRGEQVYERIAALRPDMPVIVVSGDALLHSDKFPNVYRILEKPYSVSMLGSVVREALDARHTRAQ